MARAVRCCAALLLSSAAALAAAGWRPGWLEALGVELAPPPRAGGWTVCGPDENVGKAQGRLAARERVVAWLIAGELSLPEAAAYFRFFDRDAPQGDAARQFLPGATDEEKSCRQVILWVRNRTPGPAGAAAAARLEAELAAHLRRPPSGLRVARR